MSLSQKEARRLVKRRHTIRKVMQVLDPVAHTAPLTPWERFGRFVIVTLMGGK